MATELKGDFIGFSFDGIRSEELGLVRVSSSNRYVEDLNPTTQDSTVQVPGGDGFYYFGSYHTQKSFSVPVAFDNITEKEFIKLKRIFTTKGLHKLIFDEWPYKYYMVKCNNPQLKYLCFMEGGKRIYKGEGTLNFVAYFPYGKSVHKYDDDYDKATYQNKDEWIESARIIKKDIYLDTQQFDEANKRGKTLVYNAGDIEADFYLVLDFNTNEDLSNSLKTVNLVFGASENSPATKTLILADKIVRKGADDAYCINTKANLIEGLIKKVIGQDDSNVVDIAIADIAIAAGEDESGNQIYYIPSGNLYNEYIVGGDFFKIPTMEIGKDIFLNGNGTYNPQWSITYSADTAGSTKLEYDYLYY